MEDRDCFAAVFFFFFASQAHLLIYFSLLPLLIGLYTFIIISLVLFSLSFKIYQLNLKSKS